MKKRGTKLLSIFSLNTERFSEFFHLRTWQTVCNMTITEIHAVIVKIFDSRSSLHLGVNFE